MRVNVKKKYISTGLQEYLDSEPGPDQASKDIKTRIQIRPSKNTRIRPDLAPHPWNLYLYCLNLEYHFQKLCSNLLHTILPKEAQVSSAEVTKTCLV